MQKVQIIVPKYDFKKDVVLEQVPVIGDWVDLSWNPEINEWDALDSVMVVSNRVIGIEPDDVYWILFLAPKY